MASALGFFSSIENEREGKLTSLGGQLAERIDNSGNSLIFNPANEFSSTNSSVDYRVIYIKNISRLENVIVSSPFVYVDHEYLKKREIFGIQDVRRVFINFYVPTYAEKNKLHPKIFSNGQIYTGQDLRNLIYDNDNTRYYGRKVFLDFLELKFNEFFPLIVERTIYGPVPFVKNFDFKLYSKYSVIMD